VIRCLKPGPAANDGENDERNEEAVYSAINTFADDDGMGEPRCSVESVDGRNVYSFVVGERHPFEEFGPCSSFCSLNYVGCADRGR